MSKVLKPCPFCGHKKVKAKNEEGQHWVQCQKCFAEGPPLCKRSEEDAPDWNTRAQPTVTRFDSLIAAKRARVNAFLHERQNELLVNMLAGIPPAEDGE
jgi:hypothetical protein